MSQEGKRQFLGLSKGQFIPIGLLVFAMGAVMNGATLAYVFHVNQESITANTELAVESLQHNCAERGYQKDAYDSARKFLKANKGRPIVIGSVTFSQAQLQANLKSQKTLLSTFDSLDCRPFGGTAPVTKP